MPIVLKVSVPKIPDFFELKKFDIVSVLLPARPSLGMGFLQLNSIRNLTRQKKVSVLDLINVKLGYVLRVKLQVKGKAERRRLNV